MANKRKKNKKNDFSRILVQNRKARYNYEIIDVIEAGIMLKGSEIKALRMGRGSLVDSYAMVDKNQITLINSYIGDYPQATHFKHVHRRKRLLLLHKKQIDRLIGLCKKQGVTLIATSIYLNDVNIAKVGLAIAKGKKLYDKRKAEQDRDWNRDKARIMKNSM